MKLRLLAATLAALTLVAGTAVAQDTTTEKGKLSYALGYDYGQSLHQLIARGEQLDINALVKGIQDAHAKRDPSVPAAQLRPAVEAFQKREEQRAQQAKAEYEKAARENLAKSNQFVTQHKGQSGVRTLPGGAQVRVLENGNGAKPTMSSTVQLEVAGPYPWGQRPQQPQPAKQIPSIPVSQVEMAAMREVLTQMPAGSKWEVVLPPDKAYGADPRTGFPPNVAVQFEVKLVSVK
jgi:peptidylprolyl isomerase